MIFENCFLTQKNPLNILSGFSLRQLLNGWTFVGQVTWGDPPPTDQLGRGKSRRLRGGWFFFVFGWFPQRPVVFCHYFDMLFFYLCFFRFFASFPCALQFRGLKQNTFFFTGEILLDTSGVPDSSPLTEKIFQVLPSSKIFSQRCGKDQFSKLRSPDQFSKKWSRKSMFFTPMFFGFLKSARN